MWTIIFHFLIKNEILHLLQNNIELQIESKNLIVKAVHTLDNFLSSALDADADARLSVLSDVI